MKMAQSISKRGESSANPKERAEARRGAPSGCVSIGPAKARRSPYLNRTAESTRNAKNVVSGTVMRSGITQNVPSGFGVTTPMVPDVKPDLACINACTFVDSVMNLCSMSAASCREISEPVPDEDMFLLLVRLCGLIEAKYWAETLGFEYRRSYALLSNLLCGNQFVNAPNMIR